MPVVDMAVGDDVYQLARLQPGDLCHHVHQHRILHHIPVVCRQHVLTALVEDRVQRVAADIERHGIRAWSQRHLMQIVVVVEARQNAAGCRIVAKRIEHAVDLIEHTLGIDVLDPELIAVGLADGAVLTRPAVPDVAAKFADAVGLFLPDPQQLLNTGAVISPAKRHDREFLPQVIAVHHAEFLDGMRRRTVLPVRPHRPVGVPDTVFQYVAARLDIDFIRSAHTFPSKVHIRV